MTLLRYFAYGSNMLHERLCARVSTAERITAGAVLDFSVDFAKVSKDGSGKADLIRSPGDRAWGALYQFDSAQLGDLDEYEGPHYRPDTVLVVTATGRVDAFAYFAHPHRRDSSRVPYDWYLALVIAGARQANLPQEYVKRFEGFRFDVDVDLDRKGRLEALEALARAGMGHVITELCNRDPGQLEPNVSVD